MDAAADEFPYLDGAVVAAETIGQWALHSGFAASDVVVLTDKGANRITDRSLQDAFDQLVPAGTQVDHFVLAFTGHGLTGINDDTTYWLLSDSLGQGYNIFVEELRRQLYAYGIQHLTIFSDACRAIANSRDLRGLLPRPGVRKRHQQPVADIEVARFNACQDATSAFMVRVPGAAAPGKCIFSGVLAEALWGRVPAAFDGSVVDSSSLGRGLRAAAKERATQYNLTLVPGGSAFFDKVVYFDQASPPLPPDPDLAPWPPTEDVQAASAGAVAAGAKLPLAPNVFKSVLENVAIRTTILGPSFGECHPDIDTRKAFPGLPKIAKPLVESVSQARRRLASPDVSNPGRKVLSDQVADQLKTLEALAAGEARKKKANTLRTSLERAALPPRDEEVRLVVNGAVKQIWSEKPIHRVGRGTRSIEFAPSSRDDEGLRMVEFADGLLAPVWLYPDLVCTLLRDRDGVAAISYRHVYGGNTGTSVAARAISRLVTGGLSVAEVDSLATELRHEKHVNPTLGAIAAYCYDVTGDLNSVRRMAAYYGQKGQAAPYDIVFLGMIENNGEMAQVPDVPKDRTRAEADGPVWLMARTNAVDVRIAGLCPWLRQGWDYLAAPEDAERPLVDGLDRFRPHLTRSVFTTLGRIGGRALAEKWQLMPNLQV
ncbi:hypothetical protein [Mesorhizobium sp. BH1-1-4]|uniref:hypothetical protein n=1 Tax=Mesorhizobium sp. BH1-1-4 TaxID=2876662 RepID=UPI001CD161C8|nr:hypothetical protein [Mesorhizobium sp. BH1-1-4]MBZ9994111.1 hypothetical protein [Mesorhizobium sp. BH1-1-4]